jgi:imidazolonepropionase-like amidohydrolase
MRTASVLAALIGAAMTLPSALPAQLGSYNPRPGPRETVAIRGGDVFPVSGPEIPRGTVVIRDGRIAAVGANVSVPAGARVIDAAGLRVYPGMIASGTQMGLDEIDEGANATVDNAETGRFNPNAQAFYGFDAHSAYIGTDRVVGITAVVTHPSGGIISGQAALMDLAGDTPPEMGVVPKLAMVVNLPGGGRGGRGGFGGFGGAAAGGSNANTAALDSLKSMLDDARAYGKAWAAYNKDKSLPRPEHDVKLESLQPVVDGTMPVLFPVDGSSEIRDAVNFADQQHLKAIILGGRDASKVADLLKQHDVPVIVTGVMSLPAGEDDPYDVNYALPARLDSAGVRFAIASGEPNPDTRNLPFVAGMAAAFGLDKADALKSVTLWPAQIFGVADRMGSIEVGKMANLVVTDGDLLEARTTTKYLFIDGRNVPLDNMNTELYQAYKDRP